MKNKKNINLGSTVNEMGETVTQVFHFLNNEKMTYSGIIPATIREGEFTKIMCRDGRMLMINRKNLLLVEVFNEEDLMRTSTPTSSD